jgi:bacterioferritin-associated ferredoxin
MIVCSCNVLSREGIVAAATELAAADPSQPITPGRLFKALGARPQCGTCFVSIRTIIAEAGFSFTCPEPLASSAEMDQPLRETPRRAAKV